MIRGVQLLDLTYALIKEGKDRRIEVDLDSSIKHLLIRRFRDQRQMIEAIMGQARSTISPR